MTKTAKTRSPGRNVTELETIETESEKESASVKGTAKESESETRTEKRAGAEAEVRGRIITREAVPPHHLATRSVIRAREVMLPQGETIQSYARITLLVNNGQKMPPKIKIPPEMINQLL
jgi:hypothetical protein